MWELAGTEFSKGVFELRLEKRASTFLKFPMWLGPIKGRLLAIAILLTAAGLNYVRFPYLTLFEHGYLDRLQALQFLTYQTWILGGIALVLYFLVFFVRQERLEVEFDRHSKSLRWYLIPFGGRSSAQEGELPFHMITGIVVHGANEKSPHGFVEFQFKGSYRPPFKHLKLRLLSDDQKKFYPLNFYRLTEIKPTGDWTDPDDEIVGGPTGVHP